MRRRHSAPARTAVHPDRCSQPGETASVSIDHEQLGIEPGARRRGQFFAVDASMMRRILVDHARARMADKRGGATTTMSLTTLSGDAPGGSTAVSDVLAIDRALERLAARDPEHARIVEMRFFAGMSIEETAAAVGRSPATVKRTWRLVKAWLFRELRLGG